MASGTELVGGRIPGERIGVSEETSDSSGFTTTEAEVMSLTVPLVEGRTYHVVADVTFAAAGAGNTVLSRIREDNTSGAQLQQKLTQIASSGFGWSAHLEVDVTAGSTGNQTFVVTADRISGTDTCRLEATGERPSYLYVRYEEG